MTAMTEPTQSETSLESAPQHIQLAIDLIMILEQHQISKEIALAALEVVKQDFENK